MTQNVQYITNESGARVGVLMDLATYDQLNPTKQDPELLTNLSYRELLALSESKLSTDAQAELSSLLDLNRTGVISDKENEKLDQLLERIDDLNVLKAKAIYTLHHLRTSAQ